MVPPLSGFILLTRGDFCFHIVFNQHRLWITYIFIQFSTTDPWPLFYLPNLSFWPFNYSVTLLMTSCSVLLAQWPTCTGEESKYSTERQKGRGRRGRQYSIQPAINSAVSGGELLNRGEGRTVKAEEEDEMKHSASVQLGWRLNPCSDYNQCQMLRSCYSQGRFSCMVWIQTISLFSCPMY